ncbi:MAG: hypothetical protein R3F59_36395 [Myxococcota bacterium]
MPAALVWVLAAAATGSSGRVYLHLERGGHATDLPWDAVASDPAWLDALGIRGQSRGLAEQAEALSGARVGQRRSLAVGAGRATLEVRPESRLGRLWRAVLALSSPTL